MSNRRSYFTTICNMTQVCGLTKPQSFDQRTFAMMATRHLPNAQLMFFYYFRFDNLACNSLLTYLFILGTHFRYIRPFIYRATLMFFFCYLDWWCFAHISLYFRVFQKIRFSTTYVRTLSSSSCINEKCDERHGWPPSRDCIAMITNSMRSLLHVVCNFSLSSTTI